jgi:hypothetical protein
MPCTNGTQQTLRARCVVMTTKLAPVLLLAGAMAAFCGAPANADNKRIICTNLGCRQVLNTNRPVAGQNCQQMHGWHHTARAGSTRPASYIARFTAAFEPR